VLHCDEILRTFEHSRNVENTIRLRLMFSTFPLCSKMHIIFYHSVIHGLAFFICEIKPIPPQSQKKKLAFVYEVKDKIISCFYKQ